MPDEEVQPLLPVSTTPIFNPINVQIPAGTWREILAAKAGSSLLWFGVVVWVVLLLVQTLLGVSAALTNKEVPPCCCEKLTEVEAKIDLMSNLVMEMKKQQAECVNNNVKRGLFRRGGYVTTEELARHSILLKQREAAPAAPETCGAHEMVGPKQASRKKKSASLPVLNDQMRAILVDWLIEVHQKFELRQETLYLTISIIDRFLSMKAVPRKELQLVGIASMLISCRYGELWAPEVNNFVQISEESYVREQVFANAYESEQVLEMEKAILGKLLWYSTEAYVPADSETENMVYFIAELGMMNYSSTIKYPPSLLAPSSVYAACSTFNYSLSWTRTFKDFKRYNGYTLKAV